MRPSRGGVWTVLAVAVLTAFAAPGLVRANVQQKQQETAPPQPAKPAPTWDLKLGLSYLATTGNAETSSSGIDASYHRDWKLWSLETTAGGRPRHPQRRRDGGERQRAAPEPAQGLRAPLVVQLGRAARR